MAENTEINLIEKFAKEHGNAFHARVAQNLRKLGWRVLISPFYRDNATDKAREADIIAEKEIVFGVGETRSIHNKIFRVRLIIECKYVKDSMIFWIDKHDSAAVEGRIIKDIHVYKPLAESAIIQKHHWLQRNKVAKLFATYNPSFSSQEKQTENELMFSAIDKVLGCLLAYRTKPALFKSAYNPANIFKPIIHYPLVVFNDFSRIYQADISNDSSVEKVTTQVSFPLEVNYEFARYINGGRTSVQDYFLIDVVDATQLEQYLSVIKDDDLRTAYDFL